jgi:hypothetical protein
MMASDKLFLLLLKEQLERYISNTDCEFQQYQPTRRFNKAASCFPIFDTVYYLQAFRIGRRPLINSYIPHNPSARTARMSELGHMDPLIKIISTSPSAPETNYSHIWT